jgi:hypothetical protein
MMDTLRRCGIGLSIKQKNSEIEILNFKQRLDKLCV